MGGGGGGWGGVSHKQFIHLNLSLSIDFRRNVLDS